MTGTDDALKQFVEMVPRLLDAHISAGQQIDDATTLRRALDEAGVTDLAVETLGMTDSLRWIATTVTTVAETSPSLAFCLASRYVGQRALSVIDCRVDTRNVGGCVITSAGDGSPFSSTVLIPDLFEPEAIVLVDTVSDTTVVVDRSAISVVDDDSTARTGLHGARLRRVLLSQTPATIDDGTMASTITNEWNILAAAVSLGIIQKASRVAEAYTAERHQFGSSLLSFPALRAMLAELQVRASVVRAALNRVVDTVSTVGAAELAASAGRAAVDTAVDAIQLLGGYGYIDEYPAANLLRDAISIRARGGSRRWALAAIAEHHVGSLS